MTDLWDQPAPSRRPGLAMRTAYAVVPGVRRVRGQVEPYAAAWRAANREALTRPGRRWVVLGDSMSQGVGASAHDRGWVGVLVRRLAEDGTHLNVVNLSSTGARTTDVRDRQLLAAESLPPHDPADPDAPPDLVTLMVGSNDLFGGRESRAALPGAMAEVVERLPRGTVVTSLPQPTPVAQAANQHLDAAVAAGRVRMADLRVSGPRSWRGKLASDLFHPNDAGYDAIADALEPAVRAALGVYG